MSLRTVDLNLMPMLQTLLREKSISHAARKCNLSQSSMSDVLRRLRVTLNDQLLVRVGRRMELTPYAADLIAPLEMLCNNLESFFRRQKFDPAAAERTFTISSSDHTILLMTHHWLAHIERTAPRVRLFFTEQTEHFVEMLTARKLDFAVISSDFLDTIAPDTLHHLPLTRDHPVVLLRKGHPLGAHGELTPNDLAPYRMIGFAPNREWAGRRSPHSLSVEATMNVAARMPQLTLPPYLLLQTDYFTITSSLIAAAMAKWLPLEAHPLVSNAESVELDLVWSPVQEDDPAHRWFREMTAQQALGHFGG